MSEPIVYRYRDYEGSEQYAYLLPDAIDNLAVSVSGADLSSEEREHLEEAVRRTIAEALIEYDPSRISAPRPARTSDRAVAASVKGLPMTEEVAEYVERRVEREVEHELTHTV